LVFLLAKALVPCLAVSNINHLTKIISFQLSLTSKGEFPSAGASAPNPQESIYPIKLASQGLPRLLDSNKGLKESPAHK
jgi:hypothetical protein